MVPVFLHVRRIGYTVYWLALAVASISFALKQFVNNYWLPFGTTSIFLCIAVMALLTARKDLKGFAGIARGLEEEKLHLVRLRKRGLITPLPEDMPSYFGVVPNASKETQRLSWSAEGNLAAMQAILEKKMPVIAVTGCRLSVNSLQVRPDPALINYFYWRGKTHEEAATAASEVMQTEPSMYCKELSLAIVDYAYRPYLPFNPELFSLPATAVLLVPSDRKRPKRIN